MFLITYPAFNRKNRRSQRPAINKDGYDERELQKALELSRESDSNTPASDSNPLHVFSFPASRSVESAPSQPAAATEGHRRRGRSAAPNSGQRQPASELGAAPQPISPVACQTASIVVLESQGPTSAGQSLNMTEDDDDDIVATTLGLPPRAVQRFRPEELESISLLDSQTLGLPPRAAQRSRPEELESVSLLDSQTQSLLPCQSSPPRPFRPQHILSDEECTQRRLASQDRICSLPSFQPVTAASTAAAAALAMQEVCDTELLVLFTRPWYGICSTIAFTIMNAD